MKNKQIQAITRDNKIKVFKRNKEDKKLFLSYLRGEGDIFISVSKEPVTTKEDGTKIYRCEIDTKEMSRKTNEFLKDVTAFLCGFIAMGLINLF